MTYARGDPQVHLTLWWEALRAPGGDYTVFAHLVDAGGQLRATGDGPPLAGGFPTRMWQPGDRVQDEHIIPLPSDLPAGVYTVRVGWYDRDTEARLPLDSAGDYCDLGAVTLEP